MIPRQSYSFSGTVVTFYLFSLVSFILHTLASPTPPYCRHDQRDALMEFKHEFPVNKSNPTAFHMSSWNKSSDCCSWDGVTCDAKSGKVILLDLFGVSLNNSLKPNSALFKLQYLQNLSLSNLNGEIPSSLGNLSHLVELQLWGNNFVGQIPFSVGNLTQLRTLRLNDNNLSGKIPVSIGNLTQLRTLRLSYNNLIGKIPVSFANLTKLIMVDLSFNNFEYELPPDMSRLQDLEEFDVRSNSFSGSFPTFLFTIPSLQFLYLRENQFKGPIDFGNTSSSSKLNSLLIDHNKLDGPIPESISQFLNLYFVDLGYNNFIGPIPKSISKLVSLSFLDLSNNKLEGIVPGSFWRIYELKLSHNSFSSLEKPLEIYDRVPMSVLRLDSNSFPGPFPPWICNFNRTLHILDLSNNRFSGGIPQCLSDFTISLQVLSLRNNNFNGTLPDMFVNTAELKVLDISRNRLEGKLPKSLLNCQAMEFLNVESNNFKDKFPSWLGSLSSLNVLILRSNKFYGPLYQQNLSIGFQNIKVIDVSHNGFTGTFPAFYFSNWRKMTTLNKEDHDGTYMEEVVHYRDSYSYSMEMMHKGVYREFERIRKDFVAIDFSENKFSGKIPESIGLLKELILLNLSGNAFTSNIPQSLANLTKLEALDLSLNQLVGQIPQDLGILSFLSTMNFSHNNLEGPVPQGTQFQSQNCSSFIDNPRLIGLKEICEKAHVLNPRLQEPDEVLEQEEQVISWIAAGIAYGPGVFCGLVIGYIFFSHKNEWLM